MPILTLKKKVVKKKRHISSSHATKALQRRNYHMRANKVKSSKDANQLLTADRDNKAKHTKMFYALHPLLYSASLITKQRKHRRYSFIRK